MGEINTFKTYSLRLCHIIAWKNPATLAKEGHAMRPWCKSYDLSTVVLQRTVKNSPLNRHISYSIWPTLRKFCTCVHLLISNKCPRRTYKHRTLHFLQNILLRKMFKEAVCSFWHHLVVRWKLRIFHQLFQLYTHITYVAKLQTMLKTVLLFWNGSLQQHL